MTERHLLGVWNPCYAADAMDAHLRVLLNNIAGMRAGKVKEEDVHVWWGAMDAELADQGESGRELHLYLTDYRSLYVGHVYEVTAEDVTVDEAGHVPGYYRENRLHCDCWFRLGDIRRLVLDDTVGVIAELKKLRNTHYNDRAVTLYVTRGIPLSLGMLGRVLAEDKAFREALRPRLINGDWLLTSGGRVLQAFSNHRNPAAHSQVVSRDEARKLRNQLLGIGGHGDLVHLAGTRTR